MEHTINGSPNYSLSNVIICTHIFGPKNIVSTETLQVYDIYVVPILVTRYSKRGIDLLTLLSTRQAIDTEISQGKKIILLTDKSIQDSLFLTRFIENYGDIIIQIYNTLESFEIDFPNNVKEFEIPSPISSPEPSPIIGFDVAPSEILNIDGWKLYLSSESCATDIDLLEKHGITAIITVRDFPCELSINTTNSQLEFMHVKIQDGPSVNISDYFQSTREFINNARIMGKSVLIHCHAGISRSATIVIAYLMVENNMNLIDAYTHVKSKRKIIGPNLGFMGQLITLNKNLGFTSSFDEILKL